jgi:elongation factor Ts
MTVSANDVKDLREKTGAGIMDCKRALAETKGDVEAAMNYLREKGLAAAKKKAGRVAADGTVASYIHAGGKVGVLVEVNCESDFVAKTDDFQNLVKDVALHIAAMSPQYVSRADVPADVIENERKIFRAQALESGKPEKVVDKIVDGKLDKFYKDACLLEQPFVKDPDTTLEKLVTAAIATLGENVSIRRFARFKVGEGIEKKKEDFAAEIAALSKG